jgi:hypothetical protein
MDYMGHAKRVFQKKLMKDAIYYVRIPSTNLYFQFHPEQEGPLNKNEGSSKIYLTEEQYREARIQFVGLFLLIVVIDIICNLMCVGDGPMDGDHARCVICLVLKLASKGFQKASTHHRQCRGSDPNHSFGGDNYVRLAK